MDNGILCYLGWINLKVGNVSIFSLQDSYSAGGDVSDLALSIEAVEGLGFLISGSIDRNRTIKPLQDIALMQQMHQKSGYSKVRIQVFLEVFLGSILVLFLYDVKL